MTRDDYNRRIQEIMDVVERIAGRDRWRVVAERDRNETVIGSRFQVFFDHWRDVGRETGKMGEEKTYELLGEADRIIHRYTSGITSDRI